MKNTIKRFGIIAIVAVIGVSMASCVMLDVLNAAAEGETIVWGVYTGQSGTDSDGASVQVFVDFSRAGSGSNSYPSYNMITIVTDAFGNTEQKETSGRIAVTKVGEGSEEGGTIEFANMLGTLSNSNNTIVMPSFMERWAVTLNKNSGASLPPSELFPGAYFINQVTGTGPASGVRITFGEGNTYTFTMPYNFSLREGITGTYTVDGDQITFQPDDPAQKVMTGTLSNRNRTIDVTYEVDGYVVPNERFTRRNNP